MRSIIAALRTLVLPFGATSGRRLVLDGVNGQILGYNAGNQQDILIDAAVGTVSVGVAGNGNVTIDGQNGDIKAVGTSTSNGAYELSGTNGSFTLKDAAGTTIFDINGSGNDVVNAAIALQQRGIPVASYVGASGDPGLSGTSSGTTELVVDTVTASVLNGVTYFVDYFATYNQTVQTDTFNIRIREDNLAGNQLQISRNNCNLALNADGRTIRAIFIPVVNNAAKTLVITAQRATGTGTITRQGGSVFTVASFN